MSPSTGTLAVGGTLQLTALGAYGNQVNGATWSSDSPAVATVSQEGLVKGVGSGTAVITASSGGGSASAKITVGTGAASPAPPGTVEPATLVQTLPSSGSPVFQDGFESGALAAPQAGYRWRLPSANSGSKVSVSREIARSGSSSLKFLYAASALCRDGWAEQRFEFGENLQEVWLEYYVFLPKGTEGVGPKFVHRQPTKRSSNGTCTSTPDGSTNNKWFALWDLDYEAKDVKVLFEYRRSTVSADGDSRLYGMYCNDTRACGNWNWAGGRWDPAFTDAMRGRWAQVRVRARVADSGVVANGVLQMWVDGVLRINMLGLDLAPEAGGNRFFRNGYLMGWSNSGFSQNTAVYVDDFRIYRSNPGW